MRTRSALPPILAGFFVMGFADIIGTVLNQVKAECALDEVTAGFLPSMIFVWFFLLSIPAGVLAGRIGRKNTVLLSLAVTAVAMIVPLGGGAGRAWPYYAAFALLGIGNTVLQAALPALLGNVTSAGLLASRISLGQFVKAICAALTPVFVYFTATALGNWKLLFPLYGVLTVLAAVWLGLTPVPDERQSGAGNGTAGTTTFSSCLKMLANPLILALTLGVFMAVGAEVGFVVAIPEFMHGAYGTDVNAAGMGPTVYFVGKTLATFGGAILFARIAPAKCFPWCMLLGILTTAALFFAGSPFAFLTGVFVIALTTANAFGLCMGIALERMPGKANEITALMVMAIVGGSVLPPLFGLAVRLMGRTGSLVALGLCLAYLLGLAAFAQRINPLKER